jgi:hypothetical protein
MKIKLIIFTILTILDKAGNVFLAKDLVKGKKDIFIKLANK